MQGGVKVSDGETCNVVVSILDDKDVVCLLNLRGGAARNGDGEVSRRHECLKASARWTRF